MSFSEEWEKFHAVEQPGIGAFPYLQMLVQNVVADASRVLEVGCGTGQNIPFFKRHMGSDYFGIEGSQSAVNTVKENYPDLASQIHCGDFTKEQPFGGGFDLVVDRAAIAHNRIDSIRNCIDIIYDSLKPGGIFCSVDWFSTNHSEIRRGERMERCTRTGYANGQFRNIGVVHFSDEEELTDLFGKFQRVMLNERVTRRIGVGGFLRQQVRPHYISAEFDGWDYRSAVWDIAVRKPL